MPQLFYLFFLIVVVVVRAVWWVLRTVGTATHRFLTSDTIRTSSGPMRRPIAVLVSGLRAGAIILLLGGGGLLLTGFTPAVPQLGELKAPPATSSRVHLPDVGSPMDIDVAGTISILADLPQMDADDQVRDWAVFGTLSHLGISGDALAKAEARMSPVRLPYLDDVYVNQYGRGRRAIVDEDGTHLLLFTDKADPAPKTTLARLADEVRMETGQEFAAYHVFLVDPSTMQDGIVRVTRQPDIAGPDLFGVAYGYTEAVVDDLPSLTRWLKQVDDVTYVAAAPGQAARLGGRGYPEARERAVGLEELAVLYRAQHVDGTHAPFANADPGFSLDPRWVFPRLRRDLETLAVAPCQALNAFSREALRQSPAARAVMDRVMLAEQELDGEALAAVAKEASAELNHIADSSEDPLLNVWEATPDFVAAQCREIDEAVSTRLADIASQLRSLETASADVEEREATAGQLLDFVAASSSETVHSWLEAALKVLRGRDQQTCARYDGPASPTRTLMGTRVGMNLFYTDEVAKLWVTDHGRSAPLAAVPGFLSLTGLDLDESWAPELARLSNTRLWFGLRDEGVSTSNDEVLFGHLGARVFAAGHGEGFQATEAKPAENSRRAFGWFDRHFAQIAEYEPEFSLLNQIMKWSAAARWLVDRDRLPFLDGAVPVRRNLRFDAWQASQSKSLGLRYKGLVRVIPRVAAASETECIGSEVSRAYSTAGHLHYFEGGVSLAGKAELARIPRVSAEEPPSLRLTTALASRSGGEVGAGTAARVVHRAPTDGVATAETTGVRLRWGEFDLETPTVKSKALRAGSRLTEGFTVGDEAVGTLASVDQADSVRITWLEGPLQQRARSRAVLGVGPTGPPDLGGIAGALVSDDPAIGVRALAAHETDAAFAFGHARDQVTEAAFAALHGNDSASARRLFDLANAATGTPEQRIGQALCDLEDGLLGRARRGLAAAQGADVKESPTIGRLVARGMKAEDALQVAKGGERPFHDGVMLMVSDTARAEPMLRLNRPLGGTHVPQAAREAVHRALGEKVDPGFAIYVDDSFSLNRNDLLQQGESVVGNLMRDPRARWAQVDVDPDQYAPELLAFADAPKLRRVPAPRHLRVGADSPRFPARLYVISRCDPNAPPNSSNACESN